MAERIYDDKTIFDNTDLEYDDGTLGFDWGSIIGPAISNGVPVAVGLLQSQGQGGCHAPAGCFQCKMTGQGDIAGCLDAMWQQFTQVRNQGNAAQTAAIATQMLAAISNPNLFSQSDAYVTNSKNWLQQNITLASGGTTPATQTVTDPATGQTVTVPVTTAASGIDTTTLLLVGGGLALLFLLKK